MIAMRGFTVVIESWVQERKSRSTITCEHVSGPPSDFG